jgi:hypothetical protein
MNCEIKFADQVEKFKVKKVFHDRRAVNDYIVVGEGSFKQRYRFRYLNKRHKALVENKDMEWGQGMLFDDCWSKQCEIKFI